MSWKTTELQRAYHRKSRIIIQDLKRDVPCMDCGGKFPVECMDFDHRDPKTKTLNIAQVSHHGIQKILKEIEKCDIVCANCHRVRTQRRRDGNWHTS